MIWLLTAALCTLVSAFPDALRPLTSSDSKVRTLVLAHPLHRYKPRFHRAFRRFCPLRKRYTSATDPLPSKSWSCPSTTPCARSPALSPVTRSGILDTPLSRHSAELKKINRLSIVSL